MMRLHKGFCCNSELNFGDKSITHRAFILASIANGISTIKNASLCADTISTLRCLEKLGAKFKISNNSVTVTPFKVPKSDVNLYCGNSGTTARLLAGLVAGLNVSATFFGDQSLSKRPFGRIVEPLKMMGVDIKVEPNCLFKITKTESKLSPIDYTLPVDSAQVKSCILLCGLFSDDTSTVRETHPTRNHTENLLRFLGCEIDIDGSAISVKKSQPKAFDITIPNDFSTAAYLIALGLIGDGAKLKNVGTNPTRTGLIKVLKKAGAKIEISNTRHQFFEEISDITVHKSLLKPLKLDLSDVSTVIDEVPILTLLSCSAVGKSQFCGVKELRVKESDRLNACAEIAKNLGQNAKIDGENLEITSDGIVNLTNQTVDTFFDHRVALTYVVASVLWGSLTLSDANCIDISCPNFFQLIGVDVHKFALVGSDILTSQSPKLFEHFAELNGTNISYTLCQLPVDCSDKMLMDTLKNFDGANITMPFKQRVAKLLGSNLSSVNTVKNASWERSERDEKDKWIATLKGAPLNDGLVICDDLAAIGYSTDGYGLMCALKLNDIDVSNKDILVIGAGGAAVAAVEALIASGANVSLVNRSQPKATALTKKYNLNPPKNSYFGIVSCIPPCEFENQIPLEGTKFVFSAVYKTQSNLIYRAKNLGIKTIDGLAMLYFQGAKSLEIWLNREIKTDFESFKLGRKK